MKKTLVILLIFCCATAFSQTQHFTLGVNYPIPIGDNFIANNYNGIADVEIKYFPYQLKNLKLGVLAEIGWLTTNSDFINYIGSNYPGLTSRTLFLIKPGFTAEMEFGKLVPYAGVGYTFRHYKTNGITVNDNVDAKAGLNMNLGLKYNLFKHYFVNVNFDYTRFPINGEMLDISYNKDVFF